VAGRAAVFSQRVFEGGIAVYFSHVVFDCDADDGVEFVGLCDFACTYLAFGELMVLSIFPEGSYCLAYEYLCI
jgi:hypothetical protein